MTALRLGLLSRRLFGHPYTYVLIGAPHELYPRPTRCSRSHSSSGQLCCSGKALYRATSAISYSIKTLEDALGVPIFDRSGHRAVLTAGGELVLTEARRVIEQARKLERIGEELQAGYEPEVSLVLDGIFPLPPVMDAMLNFNRQGLPTRIRLVVEYLDGVVDRFMDSEATAMLCLEHAPQPELTATALPRIEMFLLAHRDHPIHQSGSAIVRSQLTEHVELVVADAAGRSSGAASRLHIGSTHLVELSDFYSKREAMLSGVGYGWLPDHLARPYMHSGQLVRVPFTEGTVHTFEPQLVYRTGSALGRAGRLFMDLL